MQSVPFFALKRPFAFSLVVLEINRRKFLFFRNTLSIEQRDAGDRILGKQFILKWLRKKVCMCGFLNHTFNFSVKFKIVSKQINKTKQNPESTKPLPRYPDSPPDQLHRNLWGENHCSKFFCLSLLFERSIYVSKFKLSTQQIQIPGN